MKHLYRTIRKAFCTGYSIINWQLYNEVDTTV